MNIITLEDCLTQQDDIIHEIVHNKIFVYPTDSLYGIGAIFTAENIEKIAIMKQRPSEKKVSIIAPSRDWIFEHFTVTNYDFLIECFNSYHAISFILSPKSSDSTVSLYESWYDNNTVSVRLIKHPFQQIITKANVPFISTSANIAWEGNVKIINDLSPSIGAQVDYIIDWWQVQWTPSVLVYDTTKEILIRS